MSDAIVGAAPDEVPLHRWRDDDRRGAQCRSSCSQGQRPERHDLHRRTLQLMRTNRSAPLGPVIPELAYPDVGAAVAWLVDALGFVERVRIGPGHGRS